mmetsp:Transcript_17025/g.16252  ORF Transcript_17025/g.16252 Transcript_17025/m.16252 type:complete len:122 (+) Transcript_17025:127-492(+)|eukprot:CAMPEP_0170567178 /NCGR_PEP_ID=MMETSP0211-20121228/80317_1 /TAXON_ID=311385 /ORGANISM="Pseudokeronopsis sp., Strain OXSARD2" /LENGTH=121 /DNA_ID=CAMNT_0010888565 /DNA_START=1100 /DNA_END=1465 /DNA_ORIENTATION=+
MITKGQVNKFAKNSVRHIVAKLNLMSRLITTFRVKEGKINSDACIAYALQNLQNSNGEVRASSYVVLLELYQQLGRSFISQLIDMRQNQIEMLEKAFNMIDDGKVKEAYEAVGFSNANTNY